MNNFQLNNTSVYLGGQCKWDIVLSHNDDELGVVGFQLSPISNNVAFNKRGDITKLNDEHSYTLKKFCKELKESFWSTNPCLDKCTRDEYSDITGYYDDSFWSGLKRAPSYQVYDKQFEYLQPLWLENIGNNQYLRFNFKIYSTNKEGERSLLDTKTLSLKTRSDGSFHDSFVNYFNNWLKYLNIKGVEGNDRTLFIDLQNGIVQLDGVSTSSGQLSGKVSCDYTSNNLLSNERPNIETDYILSTMFKNHNVIASQLFNLNFCLDITDLFDPFLFIQMKGLYFSVDCDVELVGQSNQSISFLSSSSTTESLDRRSIFSNYEYIEKDIYNPFLFMEDVSYDTTADSFTGRFHIDYDMKYTEDDANEEDAKPVSRNVLDYLQDYSIKGISDKNKIIQPIVHWGYSNHLKDTFNLYEGYRPYIVSTNITDDITRFDPPENSDSLPYYQAKVYKSKHINGVSIPLPNTEYSDQNPGSGILSWFYPKHIMFFDYNVNVPEIDQFMTYYHTDTINVVRENCLWKISDTALNEFVNNSQYKTYKNCTLTLAYGEDALDNIDAFRSGFPIIISIMESQTETASWKLCARTNCSDFLIVSKNFDNLTLSGIKKIRETDISSLGQMTDSAKKAWEYFCGFINLIIECANSYNTLYDFYGFGQELEIGRDDLNNPCYYKSLTRNTFVYRKCGKLSPYMIEDPTFDLNYFYCAYIKDGSIEHLKYIVPDGEEDDENELTQELKYSFEDSVIGGGKMLILASELAYTIIKKTSDSKPIKTLIEENLAQTYNYKAKDQKLIDYIYNLYEVNFEYDYNKDDSLDEIKYEVKMILK